MLRGIEDRVRRPFDFIGDCAGEHEAAQTLWTQCRSLMSIGARLVGQTYTCPTPDLVPLPTVTLTADLLETLLRHYKAELLSPLEQLAEAALDD